LGDGRATAPFESRTGPNAPSRVSAGSKSPDPGLRLALSGLEAHHDCEASVCAPCAVSTCTLSAAGWQRKLMLDQPRDAIFSHMPYNYPRLNGWPEWLVAEDGVSYPVTD